MVKLELLPRPESIYFLGSEGPSRVERIVEEMIKGSEAGDGVIDEVVGERHLVD